MSESGNQTQDVGLKAPKDKSCPFCGQCFTSSSLGRHLDLYIKDKNPKPPDGIHDVDQIRSMRGTITRRHPRNSIGGRRDVSMPIGTPRSSIKTSVDHGEQQTPGIPKDGQYAVDSTLNRFPYAPSWEATGVINDIPKASSWDHLESAAKRPNMQRSSSRQVAQKTQLDTRNKLSDAIDTARAAELALRELLSSWRAAKIHVDHNSMPFDFDPLALDFPALTLQCLKPPPTLFSSTQHPTSTSWSVQTPGHREFGALQAYFLEEFRQWRISCASVTTATTDDLVYPPGKGTSRNSKEAVNRAEKAAEELEKQVEEHLQSAYTVWESLPAPRQQELWVLELARGVGRKHKEAAKMKEEQHRLQQENENLKSQIDQLNRLQQPREFKLLPPATVPIDRNVVSWAYEQGVKGGKGIGFSIDDRHEDLSSVVSKAIERWKNVIASNRVHTGGGMESQKSFDLPATTTANSAKTPSNSNSNNSHPQSRTSSQAPTPQPSQQRPQPQRSSTNTSNGHFSEHTATSASTTNPTSIEEPSDQDADAEMEDDDSFAMVGGNSPIKATIPHAAPPPLTVPRTRGSAQSQQQQRQKQRRPQPQQQQQHTPQLTPDPRFIMPGDTDSPRGTINLSRSMPNISMSLQESPLTDIGMAMQGVRQDIYME